MKTLEERITEARECAVFVFWAEVARHFPEATGGDLDVFSVFRFDEEAHSVIEEWTASNLPREERI